MSAYFFLQVYGFLKNFPIFALYVDNIIQGKFHYFKFSLSDGSSREAERIHARHVIDVHI